MSKYATLLSKALSGKDTKPEGAKWVEEWADQWGVLRAQACHLLNDGLKNGRYTRAWCIKYVEGRRHHAFAYSEVRNSHQKRPS